MCKSFAHSPGFAGLSAAAQTRFLGFCLGLLAKMFYSLDDRIQVVQIPLEDEGVLLRIKAAKAIRWRRFGEYVQRLGVGIKIPEILRGLVPFFQTFVEVLEMLHERQRVERRIVIDVQALPKFGPSFC